MDFSNHTNAQLLALHDALKELRMGIKDKTFFIGDGMKTPSTVNAIFLKDDRLNILIMQLEIETYTELRERFLKELTFDA